MELNIDKYSTFELKEIFQLPNSHIDITILQKNLYDKIEQIKNLDEEDLPEDKEILMEFYTKSFFKLLKNLHLINQEYIKDSSIINEYQDAFGNKQGNIYNNNLDKDNLNRESINIKENLLPPMTKNLTVQENNNFIYPHNNHSSINTFNSHLKSGIINPLIRKAFKRILNINTKFRDNYTITDSTNFIIQLPSPIKKVASIKLIDTQFPQTVYTISDKLGSNLFFIEIDSSGIILPIDISNGSYNEISIVETINNHPNMIAANITLSFDENNGLMTFTQNTGLNFKLNFSYDKVLEYYNKNYPNKKLFCNNLPSNIFKDQLTLGWILGFRGYYIKPISVEYNNCNNNLVNNKISFQYSNNNTYTGESLFDGHGSKYFLMSINDFQKNHNNIFISPFKYQTISDNNILAKIPTNCCNDYSNNYSERIYFGPVDLTRLDIKIYDEFGRIIDINNADYSFTLELELVYDL